MPRTRARPCLGDGAHSCRALTTDPRGLCQTCRQTRYGHRHRRRRDALQARMDTGVVIVCWRCRREIHRGEPWHLGHEDESGWYAGPEHQLCSQQSSPGGRSFC